jgi:hypothetical protein
MHVPAPATLQQHLMQQHLTHTTSQWYLACHVTLYFHGHVLWANRCS